MPADHVYVHVPFCARRCVYCDFAIAVRRTAPVDEYLLALEREINTRFAGIERREVRSIYLGGGTPSLLGGSGVARLMDLLSTKWRPGRGAEVTIEANPDDVTRQAAETWRAAGVNRVSLGVQSFDPRVLSWMHRTHGVPAVARAVEALSRAGFRRWSLDLIFALPPELDRQWEQDLARAVALQPTHISCYGLTIEEGTPLGRWAARGAAREAPEAEYEREFLLAHELLSASGFEHYEVSNYARPGERAVHNSAYWERVPYVGLGPSAHGFDGRERRWNLREYATWRDDAFAGRDPRAGVEVVDEHQESLESVYLGLRSSAGVSFTALDLPLLHTWEQARWVTLGGDRARLTPQGWLRLDALAAALTGHRSRY